MSPVDALITVIDQETTVGEVPDRHRRHQPPAAVRCHPPLTETAISAGSALL